MLIRIWVETTRPLAGTAATSGGDPRHFDGWLELLRVVGELVAAAGEEVEATDRPTQRNQGNQPDS